ncbi:MAG: prolyl oligopeptidase family serine peptidase, partial [Armatimonadota bacterium]|nr:prolyl oligopeptidase family serine peptidase [Armatimonadota bacterium]
FTDRGQTLFAVVHGSQPKYTIPEILQDVERATRFVRAHAAEYGVDPNRLGITGGSAGGHLSLMQGARGRDGDPKAKDPVDRQSSRVQAVACFFPPVDFLNYGKPGQWVLDLPFFEPFRPAFPKAETPAEREGMLRQMSPITFVTAAMPPTLVIHGDADQLVPLQQAQLLMKRLEELGVPHRLVVREGKGHGWPEMGNDIPLLVDWFEEHLGKK